MNGSHKAAYNTKVFQQNFGKRSQAVSGAGSVGDNIVFVCFIFIFVNAHNNGNIFAFSRSGDDNFFSACFKMCFSFCAFGKAAGRFNNDFYVEFAPGQFSRVGLCQYFNFFAVNYKIFAFGSNIMVKSAMNGIIF